MSFIVRRLVFYVVAAWVAITVNFFIPRAMPGNAVEIMMSKFPSLQPSAYKALQAEFGVGKGGSLFHQYTTYLTNIFQGNFGKDISQYPATVSAVLKETLPWTLILVGTATVIAFTLGTGLGILAAWRRGGWLDRVLPALTFLQAIPYFFLALLLVDKTQLQFQALDALAQALQDGGEALLRRGPGGEGGGKLVQAPGGPAQAQGLVLDAAVLFPQAAVLVAQAPVLVVEVGGESGRRGLGQGLPVARGRDAAPGHKAVGAQHGRENQKPGRQRGRAQWARGAKPEGSHAFGVPSAGTSSWALPEKNS